MASAVLAKLKVKPIPAKQESVLIKLNKPEPAVDELVDINVKIADKTKEKLINREEFLQRMKYVKEITKKIPDQPKIKKEEKIFEESNLEDEDEQEKSIFIVKPKKIGKLVLFPCDDIGKLTFKSVMPPQIMDKTIKKESIKIPTKAIDDKQVTKRKAKEKLGVFEGEIDEVKMDKKTEKILIKADSYYLNNRKYFTTFIERHFKDYKKQMEEDDSKLTCDFVTGEFSLLTHQKLVRDYINIYTPYRGLLLYHGLGSGKTCSSIAIAEGLKSDKKVVIMTPASLQANYRKELMKCGDSLYKKNQAWEFVSTKGNTDLENKLSKTLGLEVDYIRKRKGAWLVDSSKEENYSSLDSSKKALIDDQINKMIENKYYFINYNGLRMSRLSDLTDEFKNNYFDNKVIIIDEAHNLISRIVNKIKNKGDAAIKCKNNLISSDGELDDGLKDEVKKRNISTILYRFLMTAKNAKIILLTGTPIINYPNEIGILFNILRGCIKTYTFKLAINSSEKINSDKIFQILRTNKKLAECLNFMEYKATSTTLMITLNPFGFSNVNVTEGVSLVDNSREMSDDEIIKLVKETLSPSKINIKPSGVVIEGFKALPDSFDEFNNYFIENNMVKNETMFKRRILGLSSFVMDKEKLMPLYTHTENLDFHVIKLPMSDFQFGIYSEARVEERNTEKRNAKKRKKNAMTGGIYDDAVSTYRIFSRAFCNYVFPKPDIKRPMPNEKDSIEDALGNENINEDVLDAVSVEEKIKDIDGKYELDDEKKLKDQALELMDNTYENRIKEAIKSLEANSSKYLSKEALKTYSPKFLSILENVRNPKHEGLHLIYSQFRTLEGIGILELVLKEDGMYQFDIKKNDRNQWVLNIPDEHMGKSMYALYTGKEDPEKKEIIRNIFNSNWGIIPESLRRDIERRYSNNFMGEVIKVLMITASGAEGIDLKNVRYVHITESYWHPVRMEQVIGRAKRICSHSRLPAKLQTVEVFLYLMTFTKQQMTDDKSIELRLKDTGKTKETKSIPLTSDEALYEISNIKENINKNILNSIKESAIDCTLNTRGKGGEKLKCFSFGTTDKSAYSFMPSITNEESDSMAKQNQAKIVFKAVEVTISGIKYALNKDTNEVYNLDSYKDALRGKGEPFKIGYLEKKGDKMQFVKI